MSVTFPKIRKLSHREKQIMCLVCNGFNNRHISEELGICEGTVKNHLEVIYDKLGARDRANAVYIWGTQMEMDKFRMIVQ